MGVATGRKWAVDFETTTNENDCRVWEWGACPVDNPDEFVWGTSIESFFKWAQSEHNPKCWFHNLRFDSQFTTSWMLRNDFKWVPYRAREPKTFSTLITPTNDYFSTRIVFERGEKRLKTLELYDSMKLLNMSLKRVAESFHLSFNKQDIDYNKERPVGYRPTPLELQYLNADCKILAIALQKLQEHGVDGLTIGQSAVKDFKERVPFFSAFFKKLPREVEEDVRQAYKGGFTCLNPVYEDVETGAGFFLDRNSMYPTILKEKPMPMGAPLFFTGQYKPSPVFPLYIQKVSVSFTLKPGKVAFLRTKNHPDYDRATYMETSKGELISFTLTSPEMELLFENYDIDDIVYHSGWKFKACQHVFDEYIDHWSHVKETAKAKKNAASYQVAKMYLNSLVGKMGGRTSGRQCRPSLDENGIVQYRAEGRETRSSLYSPIALFTTAFARCEMVRTIQKVREFGFEKYGRDIWVYSDTDSCGVVMPVEDIKDLDGIIELDDAKMGAWKVEKVFSKARFIHSKCYMLVDYSGIPHATIAGMPRELAKRLNFEQFRIGFSTDSMKDDPEMERLAALRQRNVPGGVILEPTSFTIM